MTTEREKLEAAGMWDGLRPETQEMLDVKETIEELPEEEPGEATYTEDIGVDITDTGE